MANPVTTIDFGALAAERDKALGDYFVELPSFRNLRDKKKFVVLGNRGSGKSAIFKMIAVGSKAQKGSVVIELAPEDYSYELLQQALAAEASGSWAKQGAYAAGWKYLIYVLVMKKLASAGAGLRRGPDAKIYEYIRDHHANFEKSPIATLISYLKRLEGVKIGNYEAGLKAAELHKLYRLEEIANLLPHLNEIAGRRPVTVLIDELDRGWDASEDAVAFVGGLFQAAISINQATPNICVMISLRKELYDNIPALYEDAQKVRDIIEELSWDEETLQRLIAQRVRKSLGQSTLRDDDAWNTVFAETLDYRKNKSFNYIVDRTLYRPREIIQFCLDIQAAAEKLRTGVPYNYNVISEAELAYSGERSKDIAAEYRFQYPGLLSVFETFRGMPYNFTQEELQFHALEVTTGDRKVDAEAQKWALGLDPEDLIEILWRIGFLRAQAVGGQKAKRRSGSEYLGPHQVPDLNLPTIPRFHIHPMFRSFLGLKETRST